jgi:hypothetical protein
MDLRQLYKAYKRETQRELPSANSPVKVGGIYFGTFRRKPFWFVVVDDNDDLCEAMKCSDWICFHSCYNLLVNIGMLKLLIEPANSFWFTRDEVSHFKLIHTLSNDIVQDLLDYREGGSLKTLVKGLTPIFEDDVKSKFDRDEFNMIKDYHLRILAYD